MARKPREVPARAADVVQLAVVPSTEERRAEDPLAALKFVLKDVDGRAQEAGRLAGLLLSTRNPAEGTEERWLLRRVETIAKCLETSADDAVGYLDGLDRPRIDAR